jgi:hypothetical protein
MVCRDQSMPEHVHSATIHYFPLFVSRSVPRHSGVSAFETLGSNVRCYALANLDERAVAAPVGSTITK